MRLNPLFPTMQTLGINTDLYELTMATGLEQALHFVQKISFAEQTVAYLRVLTAFQRFHEVFGEDSILLIETYDTLAGVEKAVALGKKIRVRGWTAEISWSDRIESSRGSRQARERPPYPTANRFSTDRRREFCR